MQQPEFAASLLGFPTLARVLQEHFCQDDNFDVAADVFSCVCFFSLPVSWLKRRCCSYILQQLSTKLYCSYRVLSSSTFHVVVKDYEVRFN